MKEHDLHRELYFAEHRHLDIRETLHRGGFMPSYCFYLISLFSAAAFIVIAVFWGLMELCQRFDVSPFLAGGVTIALYAWFLVWNWRRAQHG